MQIIKKCWRKENIVVSGDFGIDNTACKITPHVCRHTYCSNMAKSGMNPKTLQYLMGHSDIGVTLNTYTHLGAEDAREELVKYAKMA